MKIWGTYSSDESDVRPSEKTLPRSRLHSWLTASARLDSSPEAYLRKKFAGRFIRRIIIAASTLREVLISTRFIISSRTAPISWDETMAQTMNTAVPASSPVLPLSRTKPVSRRVMRRIGMPKSVTRSVSAISSTKSPVLRQFFM